MASRRAGGRVEQDDVRVRARESRVALERFVRAQLEAAEDRLRGAARAQDRVGGDDEHRLAGGDERADRAGDPAAAAVAKAVRTARAPQRILRAARAPGGASAPAASAPSGRASSASTAAR